MEIESKAISRLREWGIVNPSEQESIFKIARSCVKYGISLAGVGAVQGAKGGSFLIPGIGTISRAAA